MWWSRMVQQGVKIGRRVVTGFDSDGKSVISMDGSVPDAGIGKYSDREVHWVWKSNDVPSELKDVVDPMLTYVSKRDWPAKEGYLIGIFKWDPGAGYPMHTTPTIDVGFVLSGQLELIMEKGSTILGPGDCYVQRGTPHGWKVVGDEPGIFVGLMVAAK
jgi:quercetin dioxygenase-like cupin family protein